MDHHLKDNVQIGNGGNVLSMENIYFLAVLELLAF